MDGFFAPLREFNIYTMMLRVVLAMLVGGTVGFEREKKRRPAGFRTYMLVALGAGTIIVTGRQEVKGLTTAAGLWASACMGLAIGAGFYECVIVGLVLIILSMKLLPLIEEAMLSYSRNMSIYVEMDSFENLGSIVNHIKSEGIILYDVEIERDKRAHMSQFSVLCSMHLPRRMLHAEVLAALSTLDGIVAIDEV